MTLQMFQQWLSINAVYLIDGIIFIILVGLFIITYLTAEPPKRPDVKVKGNKRVS